MDLVFEKLKLDDLKELSELYYLCFNIKSDINLMEKVFSNNLENNTSYVLRKNQKIIGHIKYDIIFNIFNDSKPYMYLSDICIHPDYRGMGYSKILLKNVEEIAIRENCSYIFLNSSSSREVAHKLYDSLNYCKRDSSIYKKKLCD